MSLAPYTAVMFASYGGPDQPADVLPFMRNATAGRGIPDERLMEVSQHYMLFGGRSPINELNAALMAAVRDELARRGVEAPIVIGNRNWHPFFTETVQQLIDDGHTRVLALPTSAYRSYSSCRQYDEDLAKAEEEAGGAIRFDKLGPFAETEAFVAAQTRVTVDGVRKLREQIGSAPVKVLFVTHSIPTAMNACSGPGDPELRYDAMTMRIAGRVVDLAEAELGEHLDWELTYCSRSGAPHIPWLEPDVNDRMEELPAGLGVVAVPIGFISDHMEVAYDLDTQAKETAAEHGLPYLRAATVGTDPGFIAMLADKLLEMAAVARGELDHPEFSCTATGHCLPRPSH
ncbi:ferrochelatase [Tessaracoccus caeni]|uniref:ferrochelatase n=1 Tax=Tessaracoccus caeni TaxID=3031239 RepID=UPI0023DC5A20|nr:ferrochelatase [Tessaracoccus caeni]MDF1490030.1 ferrochelatase [Tessaracoccus caeni]